ncbi:arylamine N-acetyltransferase [Actinomadura sp. NPDC047616]|uniref:arylamine N-acetyltransferase family protein n=1 Tax=Actinomadura sp. NPDC047616 TaxID=3155914 RepID=UPI0033C2942F
MTFSPGWDGDALDVDAYLRRLGFDGAPSPTLATLRALHRAHVTSIPFENLEIMLRRAVPLDIPALQDKMVYGRRGGYCFEHNRLFAAALERLGFRFTALIGRVTMGAENKIRPATHALLRVEIDGRAWLCDVGFGAGPLEPLEFTDGAASTQGDGWRYRLERLGPVDERVPHVALWTLFQAPAPGTADGWVDRHNFTENPAFPIDYEVANHYVSTHPRSPFTSRPFAQRYTAGAHHVLDGLTLTTSRPDGSADKRELSPGELTDALADVFGIVLHEADAARLTASLSR